MSGPVPKYHIAPSFSIPPLEAGGSLELGSIIESLSNAEDSPLNADCHIKIPSSDIFCGHQTNFTSTIGNLVNGEVGLFARATGVEGVGGEISLGGGRDAEDVIHARGLDTIYFAPTQSYVEKAMAQDDVKDYITASGGKAIFMVTGLKTAKVSSMTSKRTRKVDVKAELGLMQPGGLPFELGPKGILSRERKVEMGFEDSTDFIIGIRVRELMYKRHWLKRERKLVNREWNKGAKMVDDEEEEGLEEVVDLGGDDYEPDVAR